jgi:carbon monoxide dehydrogenase subunit G
MELTNEFEVAVPLDEAWAVLTDVERIAPCLPGAELKEIEGDEYRGVVKVKVGPITASYQGVAQFEQLDEVAHRAVLKAEGRETRGQGNASATITATLSPSQIGTKVEVATDLAITGKVAQFARGTLADVSAKLLDQFVRNLETMVLSPDAVGGGNHGARLERTTVPKAKAAPKAKAVPDPDRVKDLVEPEPKAEHEDKVKPDAKAKVAPEDKVKLEVNAKAEPKAEPKAESEREAEPEAKAEPEAEAGAEADGAKPQPETAVEPDSSKPTVRHIQSIPTEPVDLVGIAGPSIARRLLPYASIAGALFLARIVVYALRRRRS